MEVRGLGRTGLEVSALAFGGMTFGGVGNYAAIGSVDVDGARRLLDQAIEAGVTLVDTADTYSYGLAEEVLGHVVQGRRDRIVLATKAGQRTTEGGPHPGSTRTHLIRACEDSLRRLQTDHIDLYQLHVWDGQTPLEESLGALDELVRQGKVLHVGCSNFSAWHLSRALHVAERDQLPRMVAHQVHYSLLNREIEYELAPLGMEESVGTIVWSPLAGGVLAGKQRLDGPPTPGTRLSEMGETVPTDRDRAKAVMKVLRRAAADLDTEPVTVAIAWLLAKPWVSSILLGARNPEQLRGTLSAAELVLPTEIEHQLDDASAPPLIYPYYHQRRFARLSDAENMVLRGSSGTLRRVADEEWTSNE